jgi:hypothetical protein
MVCKELILQTQTIIVKWKAKGSNKKMIMNGKKKQKFEGSNKKKGMQMKKRLWSSVFSRSFWIILIIM